MGTPPFKPKVEGFEERLTPAVTYTEAAAAFAFTEAASEELGIIWQHAADPKTARSLEYHRTYLTQQVFVHNAQAQILGEYAAYLNNEIALNPAQADALTPLAQKAAAGAAQALGNAAYAEVYAVGFGQNPSVFSPPPPVSPPPTPGTEPLNPTDASGVSRTIPSLTDPAWRTTDSGLRIWDVIEGTGDGYAAGSTATVHYIGWLTNGTVFDSSIDSGDSPFNANLAGGVIEGWIEGIPGLKPGGLRRLDIPAELAYGSQERGNIPANSRLVFEIKGLTPGTTTTVP
jgi:FKBP-type peptidyl-prolyl cis-trans isomerase FkpA